jgi:hypothetical protein
MCRTLEQLDLDVACDLGSTMLDMLGTIKSAKADLTTKSELSDIRLISYRTDQRSPKTLSRLLLDSRVYERVICLADGQRICSAPEHTEAGDIVVMLNGGGYLYVLRPVGDNFTFVEVAFMAGYVNGEVVQQPGWEEKLQTFSII